MSARPWHTFKHSPKTDFSAGQINNRDYILLLLAQNGNMSRRDLVKALRSWRGPWRVDDEGKEFHVNFGDYLNFYYGHCSVDFLCAGKIPTYYGSSGISKYKGRRWWYRVRKAEYAISADGMKRLSELGVTELG